MKNSTERILITGALGQIGTELTAKLVEIHGKENVIASGLDRWDKTLTQAGYYERMDVTNTQRSIIGVLFFGSLVFAGITSLISVVEVIVAAVQDKWKVARVPATLAVCIPMAVISTLLFGTTTGLPVLDVLDKFINVYGIVAAGFMYVLALVVWEKLPLLRKHVNSVSSFKIGII